MLPVNCSSMPFAHFSTELLAFPNFFWPNLTKAFIGITESQALPMSSIIPSFQCGDAHRVSYTAWAGKKLLPTWLSATQTVKWVRESTEQTPGTERSATGTGAPQKGTACTNRKPQRWLSTERMTLYVRKKGSMSKWGFLGPFQKMPFHPTVC